MGFLDKVKGFFIEDSGEVDERVREKIEVREKIDIDDVEGLLNGKREEIEGLMLGNKKGLHGELGLVIDKLEEDVEVLASVDLDEKSGGDKIKRFNELGREDYLESLNRFIEVLKDRGNDVVVIDEGLKKFVRSSNKSYSRVILLIGKEMESVVKDITSVSKIVDKFFKENSDLVARMERVDRLLKMNEERVEGEVRIEEVKKEIEECVDSLEKYEDELKEIEKGIEKIRKGDEYGKLLELEESFRDKESVIKGIKSKLDLLLDRRVLEKFIYLDRDSDEAGIVRGYLDDSVKMIIGDEELGMVGILKKVCGKVRDGVISVKDSEKVIGRIGISGEVFKGHREDVVGLRGEMEEIDREIGKLIFVRERLKEMDIRKGGISGKIDEVKNEKELLEKKLEKVVDRIEELVEELVGVGF
ncbi:hypothetical protein CMI38_07155 [Candidatus Pacearchaeota archaeon]|jgi:hypothetical protein|nr:hypothetical protein [Candidatus Pacearchaeota archaeon]|tara:strand:- start:6381 stop:7628 length:1248 start_codon:yes stop_codon:yes gene_type:complete